MKLKLKSKKKKRKIILKQRKPDSDSAHQNNESVLKLLNEFTYAKASLPNYKKQIAGFIREWYEKIFNKFPPWKEQHIEMIILKIEYKLFKKDYDNANLFLSPKTLQCYKASQKFNIEGLAKNMRSIMKAKIKSK